MVLDEEVRYTFTLVDNITLVVERIAAAEEKLEKKTEKAKDAIDSQNISFIAQLAAVTAVYTGVGILNRSMTELGLISEEDAKSLRKVQAAVGLVTGSYQLMRGAIQIVKGLRNAEVALAAVQTYRSVLKNPAALGLVAIGIGAAAGIGGFIAGRGGGGSRTEVQQNIQFNGGAGLTAQNQRSLARQSFESVGGG